MEFDDIAAEVRTDGLVVVTLQDLRESLDYRKLGPRVLAEIATTLAGAGLGYFPRRTIDENDQPRQWEEVRIYAKNSAVGKIIDAVLEPGPANDTFLLEVSSQDDAKAAEILDQIRTLIES
ncbi:hypothetical protein [Dietzia cinnamea]|uniref:hypothetical protein n=1 Tax=Dietzia cinnamea TaxID=321318 RepID=UPI00195AF9A4|nr:hypothetical protein [Dietzia cinnamea]MBM7231083.1 hypothetical protein [Dietzia cinnamea]MCT2061622.1 hypothetical protein [Dietzia cinnamea]MCT2237737.1 hypothetical protein [Dietzia cinnamea]